MTNSPRNTLWLITGISGISILGWLVSTTAPTSPSSIFIFFALIYFSCFSLGLFFFNHTRRAVFCATGITLFLFLRLLGLRQPLYPILLVASLLSLELLVYKR
ncbi:hypothetical protein KBC80_03075 [Candidatus Woesebacteria bacterium]|nr:hypothetical protein [Candidatus Woesebacteria bacterium]